MLSMLRVASGDRAVTAGVSSSARPASRRDCSCGASHLGMPIRVPQASMAPQLRARRDAPRDAEPLEEPGADDRAPDTVRDMMTLMQQGWKRGRADDLEDPAETSDNGTER